MIIFVTKIIINFLKLFRQRDQEQGGRLKVLEEELKAQENEVIKVETQLKSSKDSIKQEERKKSQIIKGRKTDEKALDEKSKTADELKSVYDKLRENDEKCENALKVAQARYEDISVGKFSSDSGDGKSASLQQQLMDLKGNLTKAQTTVKTSDMKLKHNAESLKKAKAEMKKTDAEYNKDTQNLKKYETEVNKLSQELGNITYEDGAYEREEENVRSLKHDYNATKSHVNNISAKTPWLNFQFSDPEPNFDRSLVHGVAAKLFKIRDHKFTVALDTAGGGKVSNILNIFNLCQFAIFIKMQCLRYYLL